MRCGNPKALGDGRRWCIPAEVAPRWSASSPMRMSALTKRLASGKAGYLRRRILPEEANRVHALGEPALEFPRENERYYPQGTMAAHILGYVDNKAMGRWAWKRCSTTVDRSGHARHAAVLSIDARVQGALEDDLAWGMARAQARGAAGIVLDVDTGEVMALASLPASTPMRCARSISRQPAGQANIFNRATSQISSWAA
jgi:cell division protein FtsI (penicillin-binding protein 3)